MRNLTMLAMVLVLVGCDMGRNEGYDTECTSYTDVQGNTVTQCKDLNAVYENYDDNGILIFNEGETVTVYDLEDDTSIDIEITRDI